MSRARSLWLVWLAACSTADDTRHADLSLLNSDLALLGVFDERERLIRSLVVELDDQEAGALFLTVPEAGGVWGLGFDRAALASRSPRVDWSRLRELAFREHRREVYDCPEGIVASDGLSAVALAPADAVAFALEPGASEPRRLGSDLERLSGLDLQVPIAAERCAGHEQPTLRPFGDRERVIRVGTAVGPTTVEDEAPPRLMAIHRVDASRVLALFRPFLVLLERGQGFINTSGRFIMAGEGQEFHALAVGSRSSTTGAHRVFVIEHAKAEASTASRLLEFSLSEMALGPPRLRWESPAEIPGVHLTHGDERLLLFQAPNLLLREDSPGGPLNLHATLPLQQGPPKLTPRFSRTQVPSHPLALFGTHRGAVFLGDVQSGDWRSLSDGLEPGFSVEAFVSDTRSDGAPQLWAGNDGGFLYQTEVGSSGWVRRPVRLDPRLVLAQCANVAEDPCGWGVPKHAWVHLGAAENAGAEPRLLAFPDLCSVAYFIEPSGCTGHISLAETGSLWRDIDDEWVDAQSSEGFVTVFSERGAIYELEVAR